MRIRIIAGIVAATSVALGFVHPFGNPRVEPSTGLGTLLHDANIPAESRNILAAKCADCHSNETRWPIYARLAPGSWLIERDVVEGRKHMNLSKWREIPPEDLTVLKSKIAAKARSGAMPPPQYLVLHWGAKLSPAEVRSLANLGADSGQSEAPLAGEGDAARGKALFQKRCTGCHALEADREGPRLAGVFGRKAGSVQGFTYSAGLKKLGITWTVANLDRWLTDPDQMVPDNNMSFRVPKADERRDLIAFLKR